MKILNTIEKKPTQPTKPSPKPKIPERRIPEPAPKRDQPFPKTPRFNPPPPPPPKEKSE